MRSSLSGDVTPRFQKIPEASSVMMLRPDVLFSDGASAPFGYGHHTGTVVELPYDTRPLSGPELDRVGRDLGRCTAAAVFDV